jgi:hypothetical protein
LSIPYLAGLGMAAALLASPRRPLLRHERAQRLALAFASGLVVNYALGTLIPDLSLVLASGWLIATLVLTWLLVRKRPMLRDLLGMGSTRWLLTCCVLLAFAGAILFEPLQAWDARSIWFFQAKRIFFNGGLDISQGWTNRAYGFSHVDYPKLLPLLGAQFAHAFGLWNEYIPKASLLVLLLPVVLALAGLAERFRFGLLFIAGTFLLMTKELIWNGYIDTYLCLYGAVSVLYFARWLATRATLELAVGGAFAGVAANLKNEGALLVLCIGAALVVFGWFTRGTPLRTRWRDLAGGASLAFLLPVIGFGAWALTKHQWQLPNDLQLGLGTVLRGFQRVQEGRLTDLAHALIVPTGAGTAAALLLGTAAVARLLGTRLLPSTWFPAAVALLYFCGIFVIYLGTPHDLTWHLTTSADRTMLMVLFVFLGSTFLILDAMESRGPATDGVANTGMQA